jgi:streptogramin lyase
MASSKYRRGWRIAGAGLLSLAALIGVLTATRPVRLTSATVNTDPIAALSSYLFRFDPLSETFYTYTLPLGSTPYHVAVTGSNPTHVWLTESGRDVIGHLIFTDANQTAYEEYPITSTAHSMPFRLAVKNNYVWFTERGANRVGRLNTLTGQIDEFTNYGLSGNSGLADILIISDTQVWLTGQWSNRLIELVITNTATYTFHEFTHANLIKPFGLAYGGSQIWIASPGAHRIGSYSPTNKQFYWKSNVFSNDTPMELVYSFFYPTQTHAIVWFSDWYSNSLSALFDTPFPSVGRYGPVARPAGLASVSPDVLWFTQQNEQGAIGTYNVLSGTFTSYSYPIDGMNPTGIAIASDGGVWSVAYAPTRVFLPLVLKSP